MTPPRALPLFLAAGAAFAARRAARRRIADSPLWPLPALTEPVSGRDRPGRGTTVTRRVVVAGRTVPAEGVVRLRLEPVPGGPALPPWEPGAHIDLVLPSGRIRQYSLCGDPADRSGYTVAVRLIGASDGGRGGSREVHDVLTEGAEAGLRGPRNRFPLVAADSYLFVAGGIGITPLLPMLRAAAAAGADWRLLYCGRRRAAMPFLDEIEGMAECAASTEFRESAEFAARTGGDGHAVTGTGTGTGTETGWNGPAHRGARTRADGSRHRVAVAAGDGTGRAGLGFLASVAPETAVYCCGPEELADAVAALLPAGRTPHRERFTAAAPGAAAAGDTAFDVELARSGRTVRVEPGRSVLDAVRTVLPELPYSCRRGFCGTCAQRVLAGEVDHRDTLLADAEREGAMLLCVSRCHGTALTLDL
ncbi:PDR/VanB family oxidoreductase [Streptomyces sp. NPDC003691]